MYPTESASRKETVVIGIDPGSRRTGYGIIVQSGPKLNCMEFGCIHLDDKLYLPLRLVDFSKKLREILAKYPVQVMAVETLFTAKNVQSILKLGQVRGVALLIGAESGLEIKEYSPASIKQSIAGYGRASKEQMQYMIQRILKLKSPPKPLDASDALAIAICHANYARFQIKMRNAI